MKLSLNWLGDFINIKDLSLDDIVKQMVKCGFEVEGIEKMSEGTNLVVGKVIECKDHPDSDHLHVTKVDIGNEILDIVCGAPNCREGLKVIVAKVGAKLKGGEIKAGKIRGEVSNGMLCSLKELAIPEEALPVNSPSINGIEELDDRFNVGDTDILKKLGYDDVVLDVSIYANRPDCLSMFAMTKEMAAILDRPCKLPKFDGASNVGTKTNFILDSKTTNCPHFLAKVINHVKIKESPEWLKNHLKSCGIKCINNLVDISNYVMLETGQPLHFYDLRSNPHHEITVRDDYEGEYTALDEVTYKIEKGDIMITSNNEPIGIAGIMGGQSSKILDDTSSIIIEAALFNHAQIRRTSNRLGLQTESAARFSKGLEPYAQYKAMDRAVQLLINLADAKDIEETVEYGTVDYKEYTVTETLEHLNALIGKEYTIDEVVHVLNRLDFKPEVKGNEIISHIPSYRSLDIKIREDIDEEVVRLTDFDDLVSTLPIMPQTVGKLTTMQRMRRDISDMLVNMGFNETYTYTLVSKKHIDDACMPIANPLEILSPLSDIRRYIRNSLFSSLLETLSYNLDHNNENLALFELSKVYGKDVEQERLGIVINGSLIDEKVKHIDLKADFYVLKGVILKVLAKLGFEVGRLQIVENTLDTKHFHPYQSALIKMDNEVIAIFGMLHPVYAKSLKLTDTCYGEIILDSLASAKVAKVKAPVISKFPSVSRDISLVCKEDVPAASIIKTIKKAGGSLVKNVHVFDVYQGEHIDKGYKSISLNIVYEDKDKTLKVEEINPIHENVLKELELQYNALLRN